MLEIRGHARGGQGMVTAFEIMAKILSAFGDFRVQAFPAFGVERTGAPIQAFLRAGRKEILNRSNIYQPNLVVVFDEGLLGQVQVMDGLQPGGAVLINTDRSPADFSEYAFPVYTIPATRISLLHGLGSRSLPIVNAAMIGALARLPWTRRCGDHSRYAPRSPQRMRLMRFKPLAWLPVRKEGKRPSGSFFGLRLLRMEQKYRLSRPGKKRRLQKGFRISLPGLNPFQ
ncbi:MAG: 2-oxoacid:acceptor oxidoreductase family protein [Haliscomenobacter sp.]|nr:2-oxoacid:acceptor oxidoreductase family protein [Haliscomenobacter sp.]